MVCKHDKPWAVFIGAIVALALVTLLGVVGGQAIYRLVPARFLHRISSAAFIVIGILMWFEVL